MRSRNLTALLAALALVPLEAGAQKDKKVETARKVKVKAAPKAEAKEAEGAAETGSEEAAEAAPESASETEGAEVVDQGKAAEAEAGDEGKAAAPGEMHTVVKGDTLWDLSQHYLGSPWYWPKVWSYNPEIANPHWIYPGNKVRFFPSGEEVPTQVEAGTGPTPAQPMEGGEEAPVALGAEPGAEPAPPLESMTASELIPTEAPPVQVAGKIGYVPKGGANVMHVGFVTPKELDEAGRIDSAFVESNMLSYPDTVYATFKRKSDARVGDRYRIFKTRTEIVHPVTGNRFGYLTQFLGSVKIISMTDKLVTAQIENTYDEVYRGDLIGPIGEPHRAVTMRPNDRDLKGFIVATMEPDATMLGENHLVIIDRGSSDGVQVGNTFTTIRQRDGMRANFLDPAEFDAKYPVEDVATCMAVDVKDKATTCLVTRSLLDLVIGDRVVMRASGGGPRASLH